MELYRDTAFTRAVLELFSRLSQVAEDEYDDMRPGQVRAYVFGGAAVHIYTNSRGSHDVDAEFDAALKLSDEDIVVMYMDEDGEEKQLTFDETFTPTLGLLHEDYIERAVPLSESDDSVIWVYLVSPVDLALSKLVRFTEHDRQDITTLADAGLIDSATLQEQATEALTTYVGDAGILKINIRQAVESIDN